MLWSVFNLNTIKLTYIYGLLCINRICLLGNRTLQNSKFDKCLKTEVIDNVTQPTELWKLFCKGDLHGNATCDEYFTHNNLTEIEAVPGLLSGVISGEFSNKITQQTIHILFNSNKVLNLSLMFVKMHQLIKK